MIKGAASISILLFLAAAAPRITWTDKARIPVPVAGGYVAKAGNTIFYAGGATWKGGVKRWLRDVNRYDAATDRWSPGPQLPVPLAYGGFIEIDGGMEIYGGSDGNRVYRECWRLGPGGAAWSSKGKLATDPLLSRALNINGRVYLIGGCPDVVDLTHCSDAVQLSEKGSWRKVSAIPSGSLSDFAAAAIGGHVYVFGGCSMPAPNKLVNRDGAYSLDVRTGVWRTLRRLPHANRGLSATAVNSRYIVLSGGYTATGEEAAGKPADFGFTAAVMIYDTETNQYRAGTPLPFAVSGAETLLLGRTIFAFGGEDRMRGRTARTLAGMLP